MRTFCTGVYDIGIAAIFAGFCFFHKAAYCAAVFCNEPLNVELFKDHAVEIK